MAYDVDALEGQGYFLNVSFVRGLRFYRSNDDARPRSAFESLLLKRIFSILFLDDCQCMACGAGVCPGQ